VEKKKHFMDLQDFGDLIVTCLSEHSRNRKAGRCIGKGLSLEETKKEDNPYQTYQALYIDKKTGKPTKMIVKDINQKTLVYILYTEITISK